MKLLAIGIIYSILDSHLVSPIQVVPKKFRMTVVKNLNDELRVCIDYRKVKQATHKDHFSLPFIDHVLDRLVDYIQIHIAPTNQHMTTFTCSLDTFAYTRMSFSLCNTPRTFQRELHGSLYGQFYGTRYIKTNLMLNFEKCHLIVTKGIVIRHLVSNRGTKVDKAKIDITASLSHPTSMWDVCSFLGHVGFYKRFIQNFNKIALLFKFLQQDVACIEAFQELKKRLTTTSILQAPYWELPFELMYDVSNLALGVVLGQWVEFDIEIKDKIGAENLVADHLRRIEGRIDPLPIRDNFPDAQLI
ncbi:Retrovirus-related Pol polyprotein, partial [Mucuna pruriens]